MPDGVSYVGGAGDTSAAGSDCLAAPPSLRPPLRAGVLVDLALSPDAGGHVKCWQRLAEAAVAHADELDLTVHFHGPKPRRIELSRSVRYQLLPPIFSTARLVREVPDHTDLAPWHPRLARMLGGYDLIHTTDAFFCYARTAERYARRHGVPVVSSIHTNTPEYARITAATTFERALGRLPAWVINSALAVPAWIEALFKRRLDRHLAAATSAMAHYAASPGERRAINRAIPLRRGLDRARFTPERRDRSWFEAHFGLQAGQLIAVYAGKMNAGKNVPLLIPMIAAARGAGVPITLLCAGTGPEQVVVETALGPAAICAGALDQDTLARVCASADLFLFPSAIDESGNAAVEAMACGLPCLFAAGSGVATRMADCFGVRVLPGDDPRPWAKAIVELAAAPELRSTMGRAALASIDAQVPSWAQVLAEDLLPVWRAAAGRS